MKKLLKKLSGKVERISILGSYNKKKPDLFTDLDILIVMETKYPLLSLPVDTDILYYTPKEFEKK